MKSSKLYGKPRRLGVESLETRVMLAGDVRITEFMASNDRTLDDGDGNSADWIELHNADTEAVDLEGWHLTDDRDDPDRWTFPSLTLGAGEYLLVFASGQDSDDYIDFAGHPHANFRLSRGGEYFALVDRDAVIVQEFAPSFPLQFVDISYGTGEQDADTNGLYFPEPTPGVPNTLGFPDVTQSEVTFSRGGGTFAEPFSVTLTSDTTAASIYYTTDGSLPADSSFVYEGPLAIDGTVQLRARVIEPGHVPGPVTTEGYVRLGADVAAFASQLPIMVIDNFGAGAIPNKGWNSTGTGIRVVPRQTAHLMLFEPAGDGSGSSLARDVDLESRIGIRVRGSASSAWPEPGYSVEAWGDGIDDDVPIEPLGMSADSNWLLYGPNPTQDRSLIQNTFLFEISKQMGRWSTDYRYVETFINTDGGDVTMDDFVGLYVIEERVERGANRIDFERFAADSNSGGWMLQINRLDAISLDGERPKNFHTAGPDGILQTRPDLTGGSSRGDDIPRQQNAYINFDEPGGYDINPVQRQAIEDWLKQMEDVLYGRTEVAWNDPVNGYAKYIDVDSFIDYYILQNLPKTGDGLLISMWLYNPDPNGDGKLTFGPIWDNDWNTYTGSPTSELMHRADRLWYGRLFDDPDFMQKYVDRWQSLRSGPLTAPNMVAVMNDLFDGIGSEAVLNDGITDWPSRQEFIRTWVVDRAAAIDRRFVAAPRFGTSDSVVPSGFVLSLTAEQGAIYYTTDGSDPRMLGGEVSAQATEYNQPIELTQNTLVKARVLDNGEWSGVIDTDFLMASDVPLRISEINYHPHGTVAGESDLDLDSEQFEFVELMNTGPNPVDLGGMRFVRSGVGNDSHGIEFTFDSRILNAGDRVVVARDREAFQSRYGGSVPIAAGRGGEGAPGVFTGALDDRGQRLTLLDAEGMAIQQFHYSSLAPWPARADGHGSTLEVIDPLGSSNVATNWKPSSQYGGSPGDVDRGLEGHVVITEVLPNPGAGQKSQIELHNMTGGDIDIANWYLSDSSSDFFQVRIPTETIVPAGGYHVLDATSLGIELDGYRGGEVLVTSADEIGNPLSFVDQIRYGVSDIGTSFGPWPAADDSFVPLESVTLGRPNSARKIADVIISEVHYAPVDLDGNGSVRDRDFAFIELYNRTDRPVDIGGWQLSGGVEHTFDESTVVGANGALTVVRFAPDRALTATAFRFLYDIELDTPLVGGHRDTLDRVNGSVQLIRPGVPPADEPGFTPTIIVDQIVYQSTPPWPPSAAGAGDSLHRADPQGRGVDAASWAAARPSPSSAQFPSRRAGDSNHDGQFDQRDISLVLQGAKYDTGQQASFREGDWNEDGVFDSRDIVVALQTGTYLQGPFEARTSTLIGHSGKLGHNTIHELVPRGNDDFNAGLTDRAMEDQLLADPES